MEKNAILPVSIQNLDMGMAAKVAQIAVLEEIYLLDAKISRAPLATSSEALTLQHKCSTEILSNDTGKKIELIQCNFQIAAFNDKLPDKFVMKIEASFCTSYALKINDSLFSDNDYAETLLAEVDSNETVRSVLEYFLRINPISDSWPYWREFVQSMSARMGFPALTVPLLEIKTKETTKKKGKRQPVKKKSTRQKKLSA